MPVATDDGTTVPRHDAFRRAVEASDLPALGACFTSDATFHSPAVFEPYQGRDAVMAVLAAVMEVFEDFRYTGTFTGGDGRGILEFRTRVGDRKLQGIDLLTFDAASGQVTDLTVMLRPLRGLEAAVEAIGQRLAAAGNG